MCELLPLNITVSMYAWLWPLLDDKHENADHALMSEFSVFKGAMGSFASMKCAHNITNIQIILI